jgi:uncharacterized protein (DUF736 family)
VCHKARNGWKIDATPVFKPVYANLKRYTKENEVTINWNSSVKRAILKD